MGILCEGGGGGDIVFESTYGLISAVGCLGLMVSCKGAEDETFETFTSVSGRFTLIGPGYEIKTNNIKSKSNR